MDDDNPQDPLPPRRVLITPPPAKRKEHPRTSTRDWQRIRPIIGPVRKGRDPISELYRITVADVRRTVDWLRLVVPRVPRHFTTDDIVQGFYKNLTARHATHTLDRSKGRLGAFIAVSVRNYVWDLARQQQLPVAPLGDDVDACADLLPADLLVEGRSIVDAANRLRPGWQQDYEPHTQDLTRRSANRVRQRRFHGRKATEHAVRLHRREPDDEVPACAAPPADV